MSYIFKLLGITIKTVSPYNHKFLQTQHGIKSLSSILTRHLTGQRQTWHKFQSLAMSPNLGNYSPSKLTFGREPRVLLSLETDPDVKGFWYINEIYHMPNILNEQ